MSDQDPVGVPTGAAAGSSTFNLSGRSVNAGDGIEWIKQGWQLFMKNPGVWIAITVIMVVILVVLGVIPIIGQLATQFLMPVFTAGLLLGCKSLSDGEDLRIDHLFAGFKQNIGSLVMVGVFYLIGIVVIMVITFSIGGGAALTGAFMGRGAGAGMAFGGLMLAILIMLALMVPLMMAVYFAPALVVLQNVAPLEAMKASFFGCLKNIVPFLIYGIVLFVLAIIAAIPFGLGLLVLIPVMFGSVYASYVGIFE